ncbi:MAG: hypothetical protein A3H95_17135 [Acidobacteria bacterium RIFCSPLOWO2_02_FULL_64_15]|nr:MAG: hypothetical protein A3H95_17135 [Acidobacteria bacterium RIFCSPLOWO2_02_FULL_64_15]
MRVGGRALPVEQQHRRHLRQRLDHQHRRHQGHAGKMSLKEVLADREVLDGHQTAAGLVFGDHVDEQRRIAVAEPVEEDGDVDGH